jgi:hypothetical protein
MLGGIVIAVVCLMVAGMALLVLPLLIWVAILALGVLCFAFWIWMLIDCLKNENIGGNERVAWTLAIALTHVLGAVIYFFAGRTTRMTALKT